jgi:hypothetical protein
LSGSALNFVLDWYNVAVAGLESYVKYVWDALTGAQSSINATLSTSILLGIVALAVGVMIALGQLMPRQVRPLGKGAKA